MMWEIFPPPLIRGMRSASREVLLRARFMSPPRYAFWESYKDIMSRKEFMHAVDDFVKSLIDREFRGFWLGSEPWKFRPKTYAAKRFEREEISRMAGAFVNRLSAIPMKRAGKSIWLDHTPTNLLHASFLHEMFPEMKLIHIYRDMRDVVSSYKTKSWGGNSAHDNALWIKNILDKWEFEKKRLPKELYYEVRMEDAIKSPEKELKKICDFLGIEFDRKMMEIDLSKGHVGRWKKDLTPAEIDVVNRVLGDTLERYGYSR
jgi:hypothetical protein